MVETSLLINVILPESRLVLKGLGDFHTQRGTCLGYPLKGIGEMKRFVI